MLGDSADSVEQALEQLESDYGVQLFVVFVETFDSYSAQDWANETAEINGLGLNDVLLAVAVVDREYAWSVAGNFPLSDSALDEVAADGIEPALSETTAGKLLVDVDEALRASEQELGFAEAEFGGAAIKEYRAAFEESKTEAAEAFRIQQQVFDSEPEDEATRRGMLQKIIALAGAAVRRIRAPLRTGRCCAIGRRRDARDRARAVVIGEHRRRVVLERLRRLVAQERREQLLEFEQVVVEFEPEQQ